MASLRETGRAPERPVTPHQVECLAAVVRTGTREAAARAMGISPATLKWHLRELYRRLGVETMPEAIHALWLEELWREQAA